MESSNARYGGHPIPWGLLEPHGDIDCVHTHYSWPIPSPPCTQFETPPPPWLRAYYKYGLILFVVWTHALTSLVNSDSTGVLIFKPCSYQKVDAVAWVHKPKQSAHFPCGHIAPDSEVTHCVSRRRGIYVAIISDRKASEWVSQDSVI